MIICQAVYLGDVDLGYRRPKYPVQVDSAQLMKCDWGLAGGYMDEPSMFAMSVSYMDQPSVWRMVNTRGFIDSRRIITLDGIKSGKLPMGIPGGILYKTVKKKKIINFRNDIACFTSGVYL